MADFAKSTGLITASGAASVPVPCLVTGYDVIDGPGAVLLYDSAAASGLLLSRHNTATHATIAFDIPVKASNGVYVSLESANAIVRYA